MFKFSAAYSVQRLQDLGGLCIEVKTEKQVLEKPVWSPNELKDFKKVPFFKKKKKNVFSARGGQA